MGGVVVRPFEARDATALKRMIDALAAHHDETAEVSAAQILQAEAITKIWVAEKDQELVGFIAAYDWMNFIRGKRVRHIDLMFVDAIYRRKGVGQKLVKTLVQAAVKEGCARVTVSAAAENADSNAFYTRLGFEASPYANTRYVAEDENLDRLTA